MAKNVFEVVQGLFLPCVLLGIVGACTVQSTGERGRRRFWKAVLGILLVVLAVSFLRERRIIKYKQMNNIYLLCTALVTGLVYAALAWVAAAKGQSWGGTRRGMVLSGCAAAVGLLFVACHLLYQVPVIFSLPFHFVGMYDTYFSTMFLAKCTGYLLGWLVCGLAFLAVYLVLSRCAAGVRAAAFSALFLATGFIAFVGIVGIINSYYRRKIPIPAAIRTRLPRLIFAEGIVFFVALAAVAVLAVAFLLHHRKIHGEYRNPAEHRWLKASARSCRRWGAFLLALAAFAWVDMTAIKKVANRIVELSPSEEFRLEGNEIFIPVEQVADGHLHRFTWVNDAGKSIRFIIVQKKGMSFGVGFDACDVCGDVGYYERKDEVICNRCDVVMNKSTIGLKGGCNPVPLVSRIQDGGIIILTDDLQKEAHRFKN